MSEDRRKQMLAIIRRDEQTALQHLAGEPTDKAYTLIPLSREMYACIERPPTRAKTFTIRTIWQREGWKPLHHGVFVGRGLKMHQVISERGGLFGG